MTFNTAINADIYQYRDKEGNIAFSDQPVSGGKRIKENKPSVAPAPISKKSSTTTTVVKTPKKSENNSSKPSKALKYSRIQIVSPENDQAIRSNSGSIDIKVALFPKLQKLFGHQIQISLDGLKLKEKWNSNTVSLSNLDRGTHTITVIVVDKKGKKLKQSKTLSIHLLRYSQVLGR